jgi:hypothetical protein
MRRALLVTIVTLASAASRSEEFGYLLIDAVKYPTTEHQPTWIALRRHKPSYKFVHVPTGKGIVKLEPGRYSIEHIDFGNTIHSSHDTILLTSSSKSFDVAVESIQFFGLLEIRRSDNYRDHSTKYRFDVSASSDALSRACANEPLVMSRLPVRFPTADKKFKFVQVSCNL